jgi:hypothetical protein
MRILNIDTLPLTHKRPCFIVCPPQSKFLSNYQNESPETGNVILKGEAVMHQTVEAIYHDGVVELKQKPAGIQKSKALVIFLDPEEPRERHAVDLGKVCARKSSVDKWIGLLQGADIGDWKAQRRAHLEGKH